MLRINMFLKLEMKLFMTQKELQIQYIYFFIIIQSVKDLASIFLKDQVDRQYVDVDEDANQFKNIEDNVKLFEIQEVDQSVIMRIIN